MTATLRVARAADAPACGAILTDWVQETPWFPSLHTAEQDMAFVAGKIARDLVTVAEVGTDHQRKKIAGFLVLDDDYVASLYLAAPHRGQGIGRQLLDHAKARRPDGLCLWTFQVNEGARAFYRREGFIEKRFTDGADNDEGLPDVLCRWTPNAEKELRA